MDFNQAVAKTTVTLTAASKRHIPHKIHNIIAIVFIKRLFISLLTLSPLPFLFSYQTTPLLLPHLFLKLPPTLPNIPLSHGLPQFFIALSRLSLPVHC